MRSRLLSKFRGDWQLLSRLEGFETRAYVPPDAAGGTESGVTFGGGVDIGQFRYFELRALPAELRRKLKPYCNVRGRAARQLLKQRPIELSHAECVTLTQWAKSRTLQALDRRWQRTMGYSFFDESPAKQTVFASLAFQYGPNLPRAMPKFWSYIRNRDTASMIAELRDFGDDYPTRRNTEANYLEHYA